MGIEDKDHYAYVSSQTSYANDKIIESFDFFLKAIIAIAGGIMWLYAQQYITPENRRTFVIVGAILVTVVGVFSGLRIGENLRSWYGYRWASHKCDPSKIPPPKRWRASVVEMSMALIIVGVIVGVWVLVVRLP